MVGFEVSPVTESSPIYFFSVPLFSKSRVMLSSQMLWPTSWSFLVAFIVQSPRYQLKRLSPRSFPNARSPLQFLGTSDDALLDERVSLFPALGIASSVACSKEQSLPQCKFIACRDSRA